jgi:hypothetical protein
VIEASRFVTFEVEIRPSLRLGYEYVHYVDDLLPHAPLLTCSNWGYGIVFHIICHNLNIMDAVISHYVFSDDLSPKDVRRTSVKLKRNRLGNAVCIINHRSGEGDEGQYIPGLT